MSERENILIVESNPNGGVFMDIAEYFMEQMLEQIVQEEEFAEDMMLLQELAKLLVEEKVKRDEIDAIAAVHDKSNINREVLEYAEKKNSEHPNDSKLLHALVHAMEADKEKRRAKKNIPHQDGGRQVSHNTNAFVPADEDSKLVKRLNHLIKVEAEKQNTTVELIAAARQKEEIEAIARVHDISIANQKYHESQRPPAHHDDSKLLRALHHLVEMSEKEMKEEA